jgi:hypothetical protein
MSTRINETGKDRHKNQNKKTKTKSTAALECRPKSQLLAQLKSTLALCWARTEKGQIHLMEISSEQVTEHENFSDPEQEQKGTQEK